MTAFLRNLVFRDFPLKLSSLVLAVLIWGTVSFVLQQEANQTLAGARRHRTQVYNDIPVAVMSSTGDVRQYRVRPSEVDVTLQGDPDLLRSLQQGEIHAMVNLSGIESRAASEQTVEISAPAGAALFKVDPSRVRIVPPAATEQASAPE